MAPGEPDQAGPAGARGRDDAVAAATPPPRFAAVPPSGFAAAPPHGPADTPPPELAAPPPMDPGCPPEEAPGRHSEEVPPDPPEQTPAGRPEPGSGSSGGRGSVRDVLAREGIHTHIALVDTATDLLSPAVRPPREGEPAPASLGGKYQVLGEIGAGGMGIILKCRDGDMGRDVAVKVLHDRYRDDPRMLERFVEEAQINGQLQHPGIVPVYEMGMKDRRLFFTMKLIKGRTLAEILDARAEFREDRQRFLRIFLQVCQTMAYAHSRGVIHRDLKPSNIMVGAFGEVLVVDWGLAKILPRDGGTSRSASSSPGGTATRGSP